ncbi:hypothetical protein DZF91_16905 [Actinomadura logoneensis]|uniref:Uncharacterized protein n=1 Tax=Actinomadura logoneensis TaxID=2293572 RepID=A0A372JKF1_9ACTN|nr:hypothetical protein [Actinomadura logoneensis]RFU40497.1 hypothetical protein DZF91_16905 [Actinomadura logoneensis]
MNPTLSWTAAIIGLVVLGEIVGRRHLTRARQDVRTSRLEAQLETLRSETRTGFATLDAALSAKAEMRHAELLATLHQRPTTPPTWTNN